MPSIFTLARLYSNCTWTENLSQSLVVTVAGPRNSTANNHCASPHYIQMSRDTHCCAPFVHVKPDTSEMFKHMRAFCNYTSITAEYLADLYDQIVSEELPSPLLKSRKE